VANLNETLLLVFVACTGAAVLMQAFVLLAMYIALRKAMKMAQQEIDEMRTNVLPLVTETKELLTRFGPKIEAVADDFAELTRGIRTQSALIKSSASDIVERVNRQAGRIDRILTGVLDMADRAAVVLADAISVPLRQVSAIAAFVKAALSSFRTTPEQQRAPAPEQQRAPAPEQQQAEPEPTTATAGKDMLA
jgi:methyl-accepting chemotaxis protein